MILLPSALHEPVAKALQSAGDSSSIRSVRLLGGGCINHAMRLDTAQERYFIKWNDDSLPGMFRCEAAGLMLLAETKSVRVPQVIHTAEKTSEHPAFILLEWLEDNRDADQARLGERLADLHQKSIEMQSSPKYGLDHDNYIGSTIQVNQFHADWPTFFSQNRILTQVRLADERGHLLPARARLADRCLSKIPSILEGVERSPSLIHGDLWTGNVTGSPDGLALVDPAVSFSDREAEIAYTLLFGGFDTRFYSGYNSVWPLEPGFTERRDIYNLYHLLNHLNIFGEAYGSQVDAIFRRYS
jgi:fructosamine-3-kinase